MDLFLLLWFSPSPSLVVLYLSVRAFALAMVIVKQVISDRHEIRQRVDAIVYQDRSQPPLELTPSQLAEGRQVARSKDGAQSKLLRDVMTLINSSGPASGS